MNKYYDIEVVEKAHIGKTYVVKDTKGIVNKIRDLVLEDRYATTDDEDYLEGYNNAIDQVVTLLNKLDIQESKGGD